MSEPIINSIDVSECTYSKIGIDEKCYCEQDLYDDGTPVFTCDECPDCYFKQLKRLQKENEELKNRLKTLDDEEFVYEVTEIEYNNFKKMNKYKQALEEIREIVSGNYETLDPQAKQDIKKLINEVLNGRD